VTPDRFSDVEIILEQLCVIPVVELVESSCEATIFSYPRVA
jgi:hypothetical protein